MSSSGIGGSSGALARTGRPNPPLERLDHGVHAVSRLELSRVVPPSKGRVQELASEGLSIRCQYLPNSNERRHHHLMTQRLDAAPGGRFARRLRYDLESVREVRAALRRWQFISAPGSLNTQPMDLVPQFLRSFDVARLI